MKRSATYRPFQRARRTSSSGLGEGDRRLTGARIPALARADYRRNFIERSPTDTTPRPDFDVITEITFADHADHEAFLRSLEDPAVQAWIAEDEARFSDRRMTRSYTVTEHRSA